MEIRIEVSDDRIVAQASRECKNKAVKKLVGSLVGEQE